MFLPFCSITMVSRHTEQKMQEYHTFQAKYWLHNGTCLIRSVFTSVQSQFWEKLWWKCTVSLWQPAKWMQRHPVSTRLQLSLSIAYMKGSPSIKYSLKGNTRRWEDLFLQTHAAIFNVQRSEWYTLGHSSGEMLRDAFLCELCTRGDGDDDVLNLHGFLQWHVAVVDWQSIAFFPHLSEQLV